MLIKPNNGKKINIALANQSYARLPIKTHVITASDDIVNVVTKYTKDYLEAGDMIFIGERVVAISQGRSFFIGDIKPSFMAKFLSKFVHKSPYGIGLRSPWTMELAIKEAGIVRIIFAAFTSLITKPFGIKGIFYEIAGHNIDAIDGPCSYTLPPYNKHAKLGPKDANKVALRIKEKTGYETVIIDANDLGVKILGLSSKNIDKKFCQKVFGDNPLGQSHEKTPICIVRKTS
jgi:F420-0:gamma-glutamyl ligase